MASRHKERTIALQGLYQYELTNNPLDEILSFQWYNKNLLKEETELSSTLIKGVVENWNSLDNIIKAYSKKREFDRISVINKCILRISIYSLVNQKEIPAKVVINEALELTREFENDESVGFINGILDAVYKDDIVKNGE
jgi:transcription antitermination protein NusB